MKFNSYKTKEKIHGGVNEVWKVQSVDKNYFAIKSISVKDDNKHDITNEAKLYISLDHPNILKAR
jgi:hypothetical protein